MPEIGATLREARMRARIDISEIEAETKIRAKYLRALENEEWELLPGPTFVKSFLRTYAEALELDAKLLLEEYKLRHEPASSDQELLPISSPTSRRRRPEPRGVPGLAVVGLVLVALLGILWILGRGGDDGNPGAGANTLATTPARTTTTTRGASRAPARAPARKPAATRAPSKLVRLQVIPSGAVYVCLEAAGQRRLLNGVVLQPGGSQPTFRSSRFRVTLGNGNADLRIDGKLRRVRDVSNGIGYAITKEKVAVLPAGSRPDCGG